jgi:hypothetical protein
MIFEWRKNQSNFPKKNEDENSIEKDPENSNANQ